MKKFSLLLAILAFLGLQVTFAQTREISGVVTSADDGGPIPGASVVVKGTTVGIISDMDGKFSLKIPQDAATLVISFMGMTTQEVVLTSQNSYNIKLQSDDIAVDEVVVTAMGVKRVKESVGYSVAIMEQEDITDNAEPDLIRSLSGKIPGVKINTSTGVPGSANKITIRGFTSVLGDNQPLFVVDGVPYSNSTLETTDNRMRRVAGQFSSGIASLDPNDIYRIEILKGAAAAALYGSRAANGVILITTKSGKASGFSRKGFEISIKSSLGFENIANLPTYQNIYGNGVNFEYANANGSWGPAFSDLDSIPTYGTYLDAFPDDFGDSIPYQAYPNNVKDLFNTGIIWENSANIAYGGDNFNFNVTLSDLDHDGYIPFSYFKRQSISAGGNAKLENGLKIGSNLSYSHTDQSGGFFGNNQIGGAASSFARGTWPGRTWDMVGVGYEDPNTGESVTPNGTQFDHPLWSWKHNKHTRVSERTIANINLGYDINSWLSAAYRFGINRNDITQQSITDKYSRAEEGLGEIIREDYKEDIMESTLTLSASFDLTDDLKLNTTLGNNVNQNKTHRLYTTGTELVSDGIYTLANTKSQTVEKDHTYESRIVGLFADVSLGYKDYLFLTATARNDWNSVLYQPETSSLPNDKVSYFYPAVTSAFVFTKALKMDNSILDYGKIRASWAKVGSVGSLGAYDNNTVFEVGISKFGQSLIYNKVDISNPVLSPEFTTEIELGTELRFFKGRASIDFTWYDKTTTDQLIGLTVPTSTGYDKFYTNIGEINNTGIEIGLGLTPLKLKSGFQWDIFTSFTQNKNLVVKISDDIKRFEIMGQMPGYVEEGQPLGIFRGSVDYRDENGNLLIDRQTGLMIADPEDAIIGDPNPDFMLGITNTLTYKNLSISVLFDWKQGGDIYSNSIPSLLGRGVTRDTEDRENVFVIPGVYGDANTGEAILENDQPIPNTTTVSMNELFFGESFAINSADEWAVYDGTVYRIRDLRVNYNLPKQWFDNIFIGSASIGFTGNNLWYFAPNMPKYTNYDPEITSFGLSNLLGVEMSAAPNPRRYSFDVKLTF